MAAVIPAVVEIVGKIFDKVIPDTAARDKAKADFAAMAMTQDFQLLLEQVKTNQVEAANQNIFVAGWRPFVGWTCGVAFCYTYVILPFLQFLVYTFGTATMVKQILMLPKLDLTDLIPVLFGMLGLAGMRTYEKTKQPS